MLAPITNPLYTPLSMADSSRRRRTCDKRNSQSVLKSKPSQPPIQFNPSRHSQKLFSIREEVSSLAQTLYYWAQYYEENSVDEIQEKEYLRPLDLKKAFKMFCRFFAGEPPLNAVVRVSCVSADPDFTSPWHRQQEESSSSGFIIGGRRVLTCAHSVDHHTQVKLKKHDSHTLYTATVLAIAPELDIAMLTVKDDEFWKGVKAVEFGDIPAPKDELTIIGYPMGIQTISAIRATVSEARMVSYHHCSTKLLALLVNVALKGGNSGGPVFNDKGKCVGVAFQGSNSKGHVIPVPVIRHFIYDHDKNGAYTGFPCFGVKWQEMENPDLRNSMKMRSDQQGVLITEIEPNYPESEVLKPYDVLLSVDGVNIANDGTVPFYGGQWVDFSYLITEKYKGDKVVVKVLRNSEIHEFSIKVATHKQFKPSNIKGRPLSYYIIGGFVFTTLSVPYLQSLYEDNYESPPEELMYQALYEERVVICKVLRADINNGYEEMGIVESQVLTFNNRPVEGLKNLASMVESCDEEFLKFVLENQRMVVLRTKAAKASTPDILKTHCIPSAVSDDLKL